ncbi:hypothetical protein B0H17DRAFT_1200604 [Mycena rosella]|uniref:BTB domain-containing protein n=1 Tax=Mycena rosella TaxID=1033263 RepID=A0AAD7DKE9_MYCRO|nr:hypothetical protein B0H17DRAFT_1200604 [Mycena rosella]
MSLTTLLVQDVNVPFSGNPELDNHWRRPELVLRASDGVDFHVHKEMLKLVSDFDDMCAFPASKGDPTELQRDRLPVILLPDPSNVLHQLLLIAYPARSSDQCNLSTVPFDLLAVHDAACKYQYQFTGTIAEALMCPSLLSLHPHCLFAIARLRALAALATLPSPSAPPSPLPPLPEMHRLPGPTRTSSSPSTTPAPWTHTVGELGTAFVWWAAGHAAQCRAPGLLCSAAWFNPHLARVAARLRAIPAAHTARTALLALASPLRALIAACPACAARAGADLGALEGRLGDFLDAANARLAETFFE